MERNSKLIVFWRERIKIDHNTVMLVRFKTYAGEARIANDFPQRTVRIVVRACQVALPTPFYSDFDWPSDWAKFARA